MSSTLGGPSHEHKLETQPAPMQQATELKLEPEPVQPVQPAPMQQATELKLEPEPVQPVQPAPMQQATDEAFKFFDSAGPVAGYGHYPQADPETKIEDTGLGIGSGQAVQPVEPPDVGRVTDTEFKLEPGAPHEAGFALFADTAQQAPLENPAEAQMASPLLAGSFTFFDATPQASTANPADIASAPDTAETADIFGRNELVANLEAELNSEGDDAQLADIDLQNVLLKQQETLQMLSNISKELNDEALAVIRKVGD